MTSDEFRVIDRSPLVHANHFIHPALQKAEMLRDPTFSYSQMRSQRMQSLISKHLPAEVILRDHQGYPRSICAHSLGDAKVTDTVGAVIMNPGESEMYALVGHPCENAFCRYQIMGSC